MKSLLQKSGLKATNSRLAILAAFQKGGCALSAEDIFKACKIRKVDLATIYRNLKSLEAKAIVRRSLLGDGIERYEFFAESRHHHHHLVCRQCRLLVKLPDCNMKSLESFAEMNGFTNINHQLEIIGTCKKCSSP